MTKPKPTRSKEEELERLKWHPFYLLGLLLLLIPVILLALDRLHLLSDVEFSRLGMYSCVGVAFGTVLLLVLFTDLRMRRRRYMRLARHEESQRKLNANLPPLPEHYTIGDDGEIIEQRDKTKPSEKPHQR